MAAPVHCRSLNMPLSPGFLTALTSASLRIHCSPCLACSCPRLAGPTNSYSAFRPQIQHHLCEPSMSSSCLGLHWVPSSVFPSTNCPKAATPAQWAHRVPSPHLQMWKRGSEQGRKSPTNTRLVRGRLRTESHVSRRSPRSSRCSQQRVEFFSRGSCVTLGKRIHLSESRFSTWKTNTIIVFIQGSVVEINGDSLQCIVFITVVFIKGSDFRSTFLPRSPRRGFVYEDRSLGRRESLK